MSAAVTPRSHVLLTVANPDRDLEGLVLVSHFLQRHGIEASFCRHAGLEEALLERAPDAVVLDRVLPGDRIAARAHALGTLVFVLPTAGFFQDAATELARAAYPAGEVIEQYLAWGGHAARLLTDSGGWPAERVSVTGCPRFDLYHPRYRNLLGTRDALLARLGLPRDRPLVVWTTNTFFEERRAESGLPPGARLDPIAAAQLADAGVQYEAISEAILAASDRHPAWTFLIRVHPSELREPYEALARRRENLVVPGPARIQELVLHCDALVQAFSTTATEAFLCGKPVIEVAWGSYTVAVRGDYLAGCDVCHDLDQVDVALQRAVAGPEADAGRLGARAQLLQSLYHTPDGRAAERVADVIATRVLAPGRGVATRAAIGERAEREYREWKRARRRRPAARLKALLGIDSGQSLRFWRGDAASAADARWREPVRPAEIARLRAAYGHLEGGAE